MRGGGEGGRQVGGQAGRWTGGGGGGGEEEGELLSLYFVSIYSLFITFWRGFSSLCSCGHFFVHLWKTRRGNGPPL